MFRWNCVVGIEFHNGLESVIASDHVISELTISHGHFNHMATHVALFIQYCMH